MLIQKIFTPSPVFAQTEWAETCTYTDKQRDKIATIQGFECLFQNILQVIIPIAGLAFFAMFLVGGFKYITSGGDPKKAAAASHTITMSFIGIIGVILSWLILLFIKKFTGINVTELNIPSP